MTLLKVFEGSDIQMLGFDVFRFPGRKSGKAASSSHRSTTSDCGLRALAEGYSAFSVIDRKIS